MKNTNSKKLQLGKIKVATLNPAATAQQPNQFISNSSCMHVCPTICSQRCPTFDCF